MSESAAASAKAASVPTRVISADAAHAAVGAAVAKAAELGVSINVAVCDPSGLLCAFLRMPGAFVPSIGIAQDKAYTAAGFGFPTSQWGAVFGDDDLLRLGMPHQPHVAIFGGGVPIVEDGVRIGAIGVSGGSADQDEQCALAGLAALGLS